MAQTGDAAEPSAQGPANEAVLERGSSLKASRRRSQKSITCFLTDGILYCQGTKGTQKFLFSEGEKKTAFWEAHVFGDKHHGIRNTCDNLSRKFYWPGSTADVRKWIKKCKKCQDTRRGVVVQAALVASHLQEERAASPCFSVPQGKGLFSFVCMQLFGPLQQTCRGSCFAFMTVDYFTKSVHAAPVQVCSPSEISRLILKLVMRFGLPEGIFSTLQPRFIVQLNNILKTALKIQRNVVVEYNPHTDGFLQESKAFVRRLLSLVLTAHPADWDQHFQEMLFLQNGPLSYEEEEEDLRTLEAPSLCAPETPEGSPDGQGEELASGQRSQDACLYCNRLSEEGNNDVFAVVQCDRCQVWAHDLCVRRHQGYVYPKTSVRCQSCLLADEGAGLGPGPFSKSSGSRGEKDKQLGALRATWEPTGKAWAGPIAARGRSMASLPCYSHYAHVWDTEAERNLSP